MQKENFSSSLEVIFESKIKPTDLNLSFYNHLTDRN
jgi:hypothetical protein